MSKKITIKALGRKNPNQLFAVGDRKEEFYFISQPTDRAARSYFDELYTKIKCGEQVQVEANISGRNAQLIIPSRLEESVQVATAKPDKVASAVSSIDTVTAQIAVVNLYDLIHPVKEQHFKDYGRVWDYGYEQKIAALKEGKPQKYLQEDRIAREVVRAILTAQDTLGLGSSWVRLEGNNPIMRTYGATVFPNVTNDDMRQRAYTLMNDCGLLDVMFGTCRDPGSWCFESEIIYYLEKGVPGFGGKPTTHNCAKYEPNKSLRETITTMLKPFEAEKPMYVHPARRR